MGAPPPDLGYVSHVNLAIGFGVFALTKVIELSYSMSVWLPRLTVLIVFVSFAIINRNKVCDVEAVRIVNAALGLSSEIDG